MKFKFTIGDRVRTAAFPDGVDTERGHHVGDVGTVVGFGGYATTSTSRLALVRFDRRQGIRHVDFTGKYHDDTWSCREEILRLEIDLSPEAIEKVVKDLDILLYGKKDTVLEDGTFISPPGAKAIIHVHQQKIKKDEPAVIVRRRGKSRHFSKVEINGPSTMIHSPTPDSCGARVWIETSAEVRGYP